MDLVLNNLQRLICHKTQQTKPNQTKPNYNGFLSESSNYEELKSDKKDKNPLKFW